ncbi:pseudouridine synthase [Aureococcus anophagefferens]|nr:pseudouridine synthase [Aureococcus anophagefferens]
MSKRSAAEPLPEGAKRVAVDADQRDPSARDPRGLGDPSLRREAGAGKRLPKRKLALLLGYRGANYYGLQKQSKESDLPTIELALQEALNRAGAVHEGNQGDLSKIGWSRAARTDKRVSAARQVVSAKLEVENDDVPALLERLNGELPDDIKVFDAVRVIKGFNCKQSCDRRHYTYLLPTFLLAPDEAIDAAFDAVARRLAPHRAAPTLLERLRGFLAAYVGTRKYHNFTNKLKPTDMAAQRFIVSFTADDPTYPSGDAADGAEWVKLDVVGQSFLMHMIRKMVAVAAEAARRDGGDPAAVLDGLTGDAEVNLQVMPGDGLYLGSPIFDTYNRFKASPPDRPKLEWDAATTRTRPSRHLPVPNTGYAFVEGDDDDDEEGARI